MARAGAGPPRELSLEEVLKCYEQPLNEEQAWALCFQGCRAAAAAPVAPAPLRTADIRLRADGSLRLPAPPHGEGRRRRGGRERAAPARGGDGTAPPNGAYRGLPGFTGVYGHRDLLGLTGGTGAYGQREWGTGVWRHWELSAPRERSAGVYQGLAGLTGTDTRDTGTYWHWGLSELTDAGSGPPGLTGTESEAPGAGHRRLPALGSGTAALLLLSLAAQGTGNSGLPARGTRAYRHQG